MPLFPSLQRNRVRPTQSSRRLRPIIEGCESRKLMSGATVSGTVFQDLSGNGDFTDDGRLAGVTVDLYRSGSSSVFEHASTSSAGNFSFTNLSAGSYSVQQIVPAHFLPTGALNGYPVTLANGQSATGKDFEDFELTALPTLTDVGFTVTTPAGKSTTVQTLSGNVQQGDTVKATFDQKTAGQITLVSYTAPNADFDTGNLQKQAIFSEASTKGGTGSETLTVKVPDGYFQLDFVAGQAITHLATNSNIYYHAQDRFIDGANGGTKGDPASLIGTGGASVTTAALRSSPVVVPMVTALSVDVDADSLSGPIARKH